MTYVRVHVFIEGKVQGVFYRSWARDTAQRLGLTGWVKNLEDGRVEAVFEGSKGKVDEIIKQCREGSREADVAHIDVNMEDASGELVGFEVRR
jgi:acylphosphatase